MGMLIPGLAAWEGVGRGLAATVVFAQTMAYVDHGWCLMCGAKFRLATAETRVVIVRLPDTAFRVTAISSQVHHVLHCRGPVSRFVQSGTAG